MKIPKFKSEEQEAAFWDKHSAVDFLDDTIETNDIKLSPALKKKILERRKNKVLLTLRLDQDLIDKAKQLAGKKAVGYQTLMRMWIAEGIEHERLNRAG